MKPEELDFVKKYANRLTFADGDISELSQDERKHLKLLIAKYELELKLAVAASSVSQGKLL